MVPPPPADAPSTTLDNTSNALVVVGGENPLVPLAGQSDQAADNVESTTAMTNPVILTDLVDGNRSPITVDELRRQTETPHKAEARNGWVFRGGGSSLDSLSR